jgi:hypothetical protein
MTPINWREVSLCTTCGNRNLFLIRTAKTWVKYEFCELIFVDWGSRTPLRYNMFPDDPRIKIYRVEEKVFNPSPAMNTAVGLTRSDWVFKVDCDILLEGSLPPEIEDQTFLRSVPKDHPQQARIGGTFLAPRVLFDEVNGFNERYTGWGAEDTDLFRRFRESGWEGKPFPKESMSHIDHDGSVRQKGNFADNLRQARWTKDDTRFDLSRAVEVPR